MCANILNKLTSEYDWVYWSRKILFPFMFSESVIVKFYAAKTTDVN